MRLNTLGISGAIALTAAVCVTSVSADVMTLRPLTGNGVYGSVNFDGTNYTVSISQTFTSRVPLPSGTVAGSRGIVEIGLSALPANIVITSVKLNFYIASMASGANSTLNFYGYTGNGTIETSDFLNVDTTPIASLSSVTSSGAYSVDITSFVQSLYASNATYAGILVRDMGGSNLNASSNYGMHTYYDSVPNSTFPTQGPRLTITYSTVPEPASLAIMALPVAGVLIRRRR